MKKCLTCFLSISLLIAGCEDREIKRYEVNKETELPPITSGMDGTISQKPSWTAPATWKELPPSGMRAASFTVENSKVDVSIVTFPGLAGGLLSNLNRWRDQMGFSKLAAEPNLETVSANGQPAQLVDLVSATEDKAMMGSMFLRDDQSWFIKMTGTKAAVAAERENFRLFTTSLNFQKTAEKKSTNDG